MLLLVLLQSVLLLALAAAAFYWRLQTSRAVERITFSQADHLKALGNLQAKVAALQAELADLRDQSSKPEPPRVCVESQPQPAAALSINKRSQAMKMIRRGDSVEHIAAVVGAPQSHIRLLQKVHALIGASA